MKFSYIYGGDQGAGSRTQYFNEVPAGYTSNPNSAMMDDLNVLLSLFNGRLNIKRKIIKSQCKFEITRLEKNDCYK